MDAATFAKLFDHSIVRPQATRADVAQFAATAASLGTATLTVQPHYIRFAAEQLRGLLDKVLPGADRSFQAAGICGVVTDIDA